MSSPAHRTAVEKASSPTSGTSTPKSEKALSRSQSLLDVLHLKDIPTPPAVKFAPLVVPPKRRMQTAVVALWACMIPLTLTIFLAAFFFRYTRPLVIAYAIWFLFFDRAWITSGGRRTEWVRRSKFWQYFADYYPITSIKIADLPSARKYVFGYHPHGIFSMGAATTFGTEATGFSKLFPGVKCHLLTLDANFWLPFYRDILMSTGIASVCKRSCRNILQKGESIAIVIGGASEALYAYPGTNNITLNRRLGFIKVAIREGADLVPVYGFGENDIYSQVMHDENTLTYSFQKWFQSVFGFTFPLFHGRGVFTYNYGLLPFRHPVAVVFGAPIHVKQNADPTNEEVQHYHKLYIEGVQAVWDKYKDVYAKDRTEELKIVA